MQNDRGATSSQKQPSSLGELPHRLPAQLVQDFHSAFGVHRSRAVHARGFILQGHFTPRSEAKSLCKAAVFDGSVPVIVRFSDFTGIPDIADSRYDASPRGFAVKFLLPDGSNLDLVTHSFNGFPVAKSSEFSLLLQAIAASGPGTAAPTPLDRFLAAYPIAKTFLTTQKPPPQSWATAEYYGVNSVLFTDAESRGMYVRYRFVPEAGEHYLDDAALTTKSATYLSDEIAARVGAGPVVFTWYAQVAEPGDAIEDPSVAWPEARRLIALGVITIDRAGPNTPEADKALAFLPGTLLPGIEAADPMLTVRNAAYPTSFHERQ